MGLPIILERRGVVEGGGSASGGVRRSASAVWNIEDMWGTILRYDMTTLRLTKQPCRKMYHASRGEL